jgi:hypothetical protein
MAISSFHSLSFPYRQIQHFLSGDIKNEKLCYKIPLKYFCQNFKKTSPQFIGNCITKVWESFVPGFFTILNTYIHKCNKLISSIFSFFFSCPLARCFSFIYFYMYLFNAKSFLGCELPNDVTSENCRRKTLGQAKQKPNRKFVKICKGNNQLTGMGKTNSNGMKLEGQ